jgi:diguanylate cyclase (GGDEF)-like protein/PAS domain S-box-containing protein
MLNPEGIVSSWNAGAERAKGYKADEIVGLHFSRFYSAEDREQGLPARVLEQARSEGRFEGEGWRIRKDGNRFWAHVVIDRIVDKEGHVVGYAKVTRDLTDRKAHADRIAYLAHLAHHDALTGLPNRVVLQGRLESVLGRSSPDRECAVLFLDLDRFKPVNDALGHAIGDELLRAVAQRIEGVVRDGDLLARLGGDEFVILQEEDAGMEAAAALAERIVHTLSLPFTLKNTSVGIGVSIGIAIAFEDGDEPDLLLRKADLALYRAKGDGKNCYRFYNPQMDAYARQSQELERDLRGALATGQFVLHYQPIVDLDDSTVAAFEALLRWNRPDCGMVAPAEFIPVAEKLGLMQEIGGWVLETACREAALWPRAIRVAVNVSPGQLRERRFIERVEAILNETGLAADRLELEITETDVIDDEEHAVALLKRLRALGVRVALDDFGTGYSSLSFLRTLPFTRIKIGRSFIEGYGRSVQATAIVQAITGLCGRLGIEVTAEGVETEEQALLLRAERSIQAQGFWFGRPGTAGWRG